MEQHFVSLLTSSQHRGELNNLPCDALPTNHIAWMTYSSHETRSNYYYIIILFISFSLNPIRIAIIYMRV